MDLLKQEEPTIDLDAALLPEKKKKRGSKKHKISFDQLKPIKITLYGEKYTIPAYEYARICACAIKGTKAEVKEQAMLAQMSEDQRKALTEIQKFALAYKDNKWDFTPFNFGKKSLPPPPPPIPAAQLLSEGAAAGEAWQGEKPKEPKTINVIQGWPRPPAPAVDYATGTTAESDEIVDYAAGAVVLPPPKIEKTIKVKMPIEQFHYICPCAKK
jgi:hypothetical protein